MNDNLPPPLVVQMHEIDYKIHGDDMQFVEIELDPAEAVVAEAGGMMYMDDGIAMETIFGDGSQQNSGFMGSLLGAGKRLLTGESLFMTVFMNQGAGKKKVAFGAPYPGKIIPVHLADLGGELITQKDSFLCAAKGVSISIAFQKRLGAGLFGGEGFIMQRLTGDGWAFIHAGGPLLERTLDEFGLRTKCAVLVGDLETDNDGQRLSRPHAPVAQITQPTDGQVFSPGTTVNVEVTASDLVIGGGRARLAHRRFLLEGQPDGALVLLGQGVPSIRPHDVDHALPAVDHPEHRVGVPGRPLALAKVERLTALAQARDGRIHARLVVGESLARLGLHLVPALHMRVSIALHGLAGDDLAGQLVQIGPAHLAFGSSARR